MNTKDSPVGKHSDAYPHKKKSSRSKAKPVGNPALSELPAVVDARRAATKMLSAREIMLHLHNEHKYITKLLNILREQFELIDKGQLPDLEIMYDIARYMNEYSDTSHHPKEDVIYRKLSESDDSHKYDVVNLLIEHESLSRKTETLLNSIRDSQKNPEKNNLKILRLRCEDYIVSMNGHMDMEESQIFPRVLEVLTENDWIDIINEIQPGADPLFGKNIEKQYQALFHAISMEMERATDDFAMAELVSLGAFMENIGAIATYGNKIGNVVSKRFKQAYKGNAVAFRKLKKAKSKSPGDYVSVTVDCMLNNFDTCTESMRDIGLILRKARAQIAEPYTSRLRIYHDMIRSPVLSSSYSIDSNEESA
jgi:hemerythrin-like domain-containing protein